HIAGLFRGGADGERARFVATLAQARGLEIDAEDVGGAGIERGGEDGFHFADVAEHEDDGLLRVEVLRRDAIVRVHDADLDEVGLDVWVLDAVAGDRFAHSADAAVVFAAGFVEELGVDFDAEREYGLVGNDFNFGVAGDVDDLLG